MGDEATDKERSILFILKVVLFEFYDFDGDGLVGSEDLSQLLLLMGGNPELSSVMGMYLVGQHDEDKDGKLNFVEFQ